MSEKSWDAMRDHGPNVGGASIQRRREEEVRREQREADAARVRAAGCICWPLERAGVFEGVFHGSIIYTKPDWPPQDLRFIYEHDPRCPDALAAILEGK